MREPWFGLRTRVGVAVCLVASWAGTDVSAQPAQPQGNVIDADEGVHAPGAPTEKAAQAKRLFDKEQWIPAAILLEEVKSGATGDDDGNREIATFQLAIALYHLKLYQASYGFFTEISINSKHQRYAETLPWLAKLATQLPEPANIIERVGHYGDLIPTLDNDQQRPLYWQLNYLLGRYEYTARDFAAALDHFAIVKKESPYYVQATFFTGITNVQLRKSVPAIKAFLSVDKAFGDGFDGAGDEDRLRDLASLSLARTYYSSAIRLTDQGVPTIDEKRLSAAVKYWNRVEVSSEYWLDALFEESWAYFMAGDFPRALGNVHTIKSPYFPKHLYAEADILSATSWFANCQYENATTVAAQMKLEYDPIQTKLQAAFDGLGGDDSDEKFFGFVEKVRAGKAGLDAEVEPIVMHALRDRELLRNVEYVRFLDKERTLYDAMDASVKSSPLGGEITDALDLARAVAVRKGGSAARQRLQRTLDELGENLRNAQKILIDVVSAQRSILEAPVRKETSWPDEGPMKNIWSVVETDDEHEVWPFDGEYWRDELGTYRQEITNRCAR